MDLREEHRSWRPCNLQSNNDYASTLCLAVGKKKKQHNCTSQWEICIFHFLWEQLCRYLSKSVTKVGRIFENIAANFLIVAFVCPSITFFFFFSFSATDADSGLAGVRGTHCVYLAAVACVGWRQWEEVSFEWHEIEICHNRFSNSQAFPLVRIPSCGFTCECIW